MSSHLLIGYFSSEQEILEATRAVRRAGYPVHDVYTPYAVHGLDEALGIEPSRLTFVCFFAGLLGLTTALSFQYYTSVEAWALNVGGKPFNSLPAFIPVTFELTVLFAALITVAAFLARSRLFPGRSATALPDVTNHRFALALEVGGMDEAPRELLRNNGAVEFARREVSP